MRERRGVDGNVEFNILIDGGEGDIRGFDGAVRGELDRFEGCSVAAREEGLCVRVTVRCPESVSDDVRKVVDRTLIALGISDACRGKITDVLAEGDGDPVFYPRYGRGGDSGSYDRSGGGDDDVGFCGGRACSTC